MKYLLQISVMQDALKDIFSIAMQTVPKIVMALVIFFIGYLVSKILYRIVKKTLEKLGIDKLGDRLNEVDIVQKSKIKFKAGAFISKALYYFLMLFFMVASTSVLGIPEISNLVSDIFKFIPNIIVAAIILVLGTLFADLVRKGVFTGLKSLGVPSAGLISSVMFYFLFINIMVSALSQAKINTAFLSQNISILIAGIFGAFAIGYGLASKEVMSNMIAGYFTKDQFQVGDHLVIDGIKGKVIAIEKGKITLKTDTGKVIFPMSVAIKEKIEIFD